MSTIGGETIQLSFGPIANSVTSHLCNLQGLACTTTTSSSSHHHNDHNNNDGTPNTTPLCDPYVTHTTDSNETYVPRVLFVDGRNHYAPFPASSLPLRNEDTKASTRWDGNIQTVLLRGSSEPKEEGRVDGTSADVSASSFNSNHRTEDDGTGTDGYYEDYGLRFQTSNSMSNHNNNHNHNPYSDRTSHTIRNFQNTASVLTTSSSNRSRYHASRYTHCSSRYIPHNQSSAYVGSGRHMVWDDDDEEEEEEEEEEDAQRTREVTLQKQWNETERTIQERLDEGWNTFLRSSSNSNNNHHTTNVDRNTASNGSNGRIASSSGTNDGTRTEETNGTHSGAAGSSSSPNNNNNNNTFGTNELEWCHYFMPPYPPSWMYTAPLPFDTPFASSSSSSSFTTTNTNTNNTNNLTNPYSNSNSNIPNLLGSYANGRYPSTIDTDHLTTKWREDVLSEPIRKHLEQCDAVKGFCFHIDRNHGLYGGLAESVAVELEEDCRSASRLGVWVGNGSRSTSGRGGGVPGNGGQRPTYWRTEQSVSSTIRSGLNDGLVLGGLTEHLDLVLPLDLSLLSSFSFFGNGNGNGGRRNTSSLFETSAMVALALETATLPYRLLGSSSGVGGRNDHRSRIGMNGGRYVGGGSSEDGSYGIVDRLPFRDFVTALRPSERHVVLELSATALTPGASNATAATNAGTSATMTTGLTSLGKTDLHDALMQGTSIERKRFEQERGQNRGSYRGRGSNVDPGLWMQDRGVGGEGGGGVLDPFTPVGEKGKGRDRMVHRHYALSTAFRPSLSPSTSSAAAALSSALSMGGLRGVLGSVGIQGGGGGDRDVPSYTTVLMEGTGIRYRPENTVGTVVRQSISELVGERSYGAGSYWKTLLSSSSGDTASPPSSPPVLTVLGNTTRIYPHLSTVAKSFAEVTGWKYAGYRKRDVTAGLIPEEEDCEEGLERCRRLKEIYEPPSGSGYYDDEMEEREGVYFEDNED